MPKRCVLLLSTQSLTAYTPTGSSITLLDRFAGDDDGHLRFSAFLAAHPRQLFTLLADPADEGYQLEDIPYSSGKDRAAIIKRKLGQHFYGTPYALALSEGRLKEGRRDERLLLLALTQPQSFEPWLKALEFRQARLSGLYSLPQLLAQLLPANTPAQLLLITPTHSGLRQTFFSQHQLRLSRLTPLATTEPHEAALATAQEAGKMHQYLAGQRLLERGHPLAVRVVAPSEQVMALREHCRGMATLHFDIVDLAAESTRLGLKQSPPEPVTDALFCHLLARKPPTEQFAGPALRRFYRLWQTRYALLAMAAVLVSGGLLFSAKQLLTSFSMQQDITQLEQQTRLDQQRYDAALQALPKIPLSVEHLRTLVDRFDAVHKRAQGPRPLLQQLSLSLDQFPDIGLDLLDWQIAEKVGADGTALAASTTTTAPAPATAATSNTNSNTARHAQPEYGAALATLGNGPFARLKVDAHLPLDMASQQGAQIDRVTTFFKHLALAPDTHIRVLQMPVDTQSTTILRSDEERVAPGAPRFSFLLIRKL